MTGAVAFFAYGALTVLAVSAAVGAAAHAILTKDDVRGAIGWVGLIVLVPLGGPILYWLFGINRIRRRASELRAAPARPAKWTTEGESSEGTAALPASCRPLLALATLARSVTGQPLTSGNAVSPLATGPEAFEAMLAAIADAQHSVALASYIFEPRGIGAQFVEALAEAQARGVEVRVLVDGVGAHYSWPTVRASLRRRDVPVATFLPTMLPLHLRYANLRNHRKVLVVDGRLGFTGGLNIRNGYLAGDSDAGAMRDVHFRIEGPVIAQVLRAFRDDWAFCTGEALVGDAWCPPIPPAGEAAARCIASGPDLHPERIRWTFVGALSEARRQVRIVTPYFLPDAVLTASLQAAAMRGITVEVIVPERSNLRLVQWASNARLGGLLAAGCRIRESPPPFDHAKMMTVDGAWALIGSANWDERSLRLNFELDVEVYDPAVASALDALIDARAERARLLRADELARRPLIIKLRDGLAWLLSPYL